MFKDFDDFKRHAEFFPKGRIVPRRILDSRQVSLRGNVRRCKDAHRIKFGCDVYVVRRHGINFIIPDPSADTPMVCVRALRNVRLQGNPYGSGDNQFVGWSTRWDKDHDPVVFVNKQIARLAGNDATHLPNSG